ncbi:hypothetical protein [Oceanobacillus chungangensis]|uniref:Uncharacterized protein n=1 Tax=Oceanobacillus chungangensis TaxID=1229152 RepID=A0A3D8PMU4_9BACI|nr:hypothetical protein [Oceanobacillus chungangensis]RDW16847.1 hypothetical protein CWR45_14615 [Oceanobacillus chungangensis]
MLFIIAVILIAMSLGVYISFVAGQGKDERGQAIIARSSQIAFLFILLGFVFQGFYYQFSNPSVDQVKTMTYIWMAVIFCSNSISIILLQKKM